MPGEVICSQQGRIVDTGGRCFRSDCLTSISLLDRLCGSRHDGGSVVAAGGDVQHGQQQLEGCWRVRLVFPQEQSLVGEECVLAAHCADEGDNAANGAGTYIRCRED